MLRRPATRRSQLWRTLFGQLPPRFQRKTRWLVALDRGSTLTDSQGRFTAGGLPFEAPLAALQDSSRQPPAYLAERHVIEMIPGAAYWVEAGSRPPPGSGADLRRRG